MPVTFKVPKQTAKSVYNIDEFKGVDLTNSPTNVDDNKSPNAINMIRDVPGKVRKRMGYEVVKDYTNDIQLPVNMCDTKYADYTTSGITIRKDNGYIKINGTFSTQSVIWEKQLSDYFDLEDVSPAPYTQASYMFVVYVISGSSSEDTSYAELMVADNDGAYAPIEIGNLTEGTVLTYEIYNRTPVRNASIQISATNQATNLTFDNLVLGYMLIKADQYYEGMPFLKYGEQYTYNINGYHFRREDDKAIIHINRYMYYGTDLIYSGANDALSHSWQFNENLYIMDGKKLLIFDGTTIEPVSNQATVPLVTINKDPIWGQGGGGGVPKDPFNLMTPLFTEGFVVTADTATSKQFPMSVSPLGAAEVTAQIMDANGEWIDKEEGTDFDVDRTTGIITFHTAPGISPIEGQDNVQITASQNTNDYDDRINKCTFGARFGVNGAYDRLFVSGNPDYPNFDWHSQIWDLRYFPDNSYSTLGSSKSAVVGYSIVSNYLAAHKDELEEDMSIIIREGDMIDDEASFRIINTLQGAGAIASNSFAYLCTEPLFLTRSGLYAVTAQDITGEKYAQSRSFYLNGKLTKEDFANLQQSFSVIFNDMYILCVNHEEENEQGETETISRLYILDGLQPMRTDKSEPYSTRQYAGFYCEMKNVNCMWERENRLFFGTKDGKVCRFYNDKADIHSYNDNGYAIYSQWETPDIDGQLFYKNKTLRYVALRAGAAIATSVEIWGMNRGIWKFIKKDSTFGRYLSFSNIQFSKFSFSANKEQRVSRTKVRIKKVDKYRLRFINNELNEPFSLYNLANEYIESGNYKG